MHLSSPSALPFCFAFTPKSFLNVFDIADGRPSTRSLLFCWPLLQKRILFRDLCVQKPLKARSGSRSAPCPCASAVHCSSDAVFQLPLRRVATPAQEDDDEKAFELLRQYCTGFCFHTNIHFVDFFEQISRGSISFFQHASGFISTVPLCSCCGRLRRRILLEWQHAHALCRYRPFLSVSSASLRLCV